MYKNAIIIIITNISPTILIMHNQLDGIISWYITNFTTFDNSKFGIQQAHAFNHDK